MGSGRLDFDVFNGEVLAGFPGDRSLHGKVNLRDIFGTDESTLYLARNGLVMEKLAPLSTGNISVISPFPWYRPCFMRRDLSDSLRPSVTSWCTGSRYQKLGTLLELARRKSNFEAR